MKRKRRLSKQDLRAAGVTPGFVVRRYDADGRARLEMLAPESDDRKRDFARRLADGSKASEGSE